ncbi:unnamed protein product [Bursaphelenchus okinawaensis]|uniref:Uncharacterized protein n=1 Tax=Bursaphelenchus okinawaensis TaxID=465554 RepID=A0A811KX89_9BILA|nr:unnamed protein product [Bursaphelenchus okinawaensis]CAG9113300.1 unnamed protein product [Bursaphelenchus okinawaensis]
MLCSSPSSNSISPRSLTVADALSEAISFHPTELGHPGRKLFRLVHSESDRGFYSPVLKQLARNALKFFVQHFEAMSRRKRQEFSNSFFKSRHLNDKYPFRIALINEKFKNTVKSDGHKMAIVTRGFCYNAYFDDVLMWTLNCGVIYEIGFLPSRVGRLVVEGVDKEDLSNLEEMSYMLEDIEILSIPLMPAASHLGIELIHSFDKTLKSLDCSALLLKNPAIKTLKLIELRVTNVSWADDLNDLFSFRTTSLVVNASPVLSVISHGRLHTYNPLVQKLKFVNTHPVSEGQLMAAMTMIFRIFPNLQSLEFECVKVMFGELSDKLVKFPDLCARVFQELCGCTTLKLFFELKIFLMSYNADLVEIVKVSADLNSLPFSEDEVNSKQVTKRITLDRTFDTHRIVIITEHLTKPIRELKLTPATGTVPVQRFRSNV